MNCPICNKSIADNSVKCPHCKTRIGVLCKVCHTVNNIGTLKCKVCGNELLKMCDECGTINLPSAHKCRKCGKNLKQKKSLNYNPHDISQKNAVTILSEGLLSDDKIIYSITGEKGIGKSTVLKSTINKLQSHKFIWLFGKCTPLTQLTPGGVIQDIILNLFNLPNFCINNSDFRKNAIKFFQNEFEQMTSYEVNNFVNFLYSFQDGKFEDLIINKKKTFNILYKVFEKISTAGKFIIVIDNFDFIDGFSYEFLNKILKREDLNNNLKLLLMYTKQKPSKGYFNIFDDNVYLDINISALKDKDMEEFCKLSEEQFLYTNESEKYDIINKSKGNPAYLEQALSLCFDSQIGDKPFELPETFTEVTNKRLQYLKEVNEIAYKILVGAAVMGDKINIRLLHEIFDIEQFDDVIEYLKKMNFIQPVNEIYYEFKNLLLWETILTNSKHDDNFIRINEKISEMLNNFMLNSNAIIGVIAQNLKQNAKALQAWTKNTKLAAYIGDVNLYVISQKQCLALINELDESTTLNTRYNISERLGKLLTDYKPKEAMEFLPDAIANANAVGNTPKEIELLGYLSCCCSKTENYYGNIECVDAVLSKMPKEHRLETALLKATKLKSVLLTGNCCEVINTIDNDIIPIINEYMTKSNFTDFSKEFLNDTLLKLNLILANALSLQGNDRAFEVLTMLFEIIERNQVKDDLFICKCKLALAMANTMKGDFYASETALENILNTYGDNIMDNETGLMWNMIKIINRFFNHDYENIQQDLFELVTYANNYGDNLNKNILKTLLGKIFKDNEQAKQALEIYKSQVTYFAKEKIATGALLSWYLIADATIDVQGPHAAIEIAEQALDVAQNPKVNNYFFIVLLKMIIAKASIIMADYETAKIHLENAIIIAGKFNMKDVLSRLYLLYGKYFQELGLLKTSNQAQYLKGAEKMYEKAINLIKQTKNSFIYTEIEKSKNVLKSFCKLNNIGI